MTGRVDGGRALLRVPVAGTAGGSRTDVEAWVDTAFTGGLTMPRAAATELGLAAGVSTDAVLADGSLVVLDSFVCYLDWFGGTYRTQAVATDAATCYSARSCWPAGGWWSTTQPAPSS